MIDYSSRRNRYIDIWHICSKVTTWSPHTGSTARCRRLLATQIDQPMLTKCRCSNITGHHQRHLWRLRVPPQAMNGHIVPTERPTVPDASDLNQRTLTGYGQLALELSDPESTVKPLYRKFEYLNHRILLHLQDELSELEEQLRRVDEVIAQMDPGSPDGQKTPASRRGETFHGTEIHLRRTHLLGNIFLKTKQYNRAMSAYASMAKDSTPAEDNQVTAYQDWMTKHAPIHDIETRFLKHQEDLVKPGEEA